MNWAQLLGVGVYTRHELGAVLWIFFHELVTALWGGGVFAFFDF